MSMFMNIFVPVLYMAGLLLAVLFVLGLFMLMRNKISHQELTNERIAAETDLIHAFKARELIALDRDGVMLQQLEATFAREKDLFNTDAYSQAGYEKPDQPHTDKGEPVLGPLTRQRDPEVPNPKHMNTVFQGGDQFGRENNDPNVNHPAGIENDPNRAHPDGMENAIKYELDHDDARYTPPQGLEPPTSTRRKMFDSRYGWHDNDGDGDFRYTPPQGPEPEHVPKDMFPNHADDF